MIIIDFAQQRANLPFITSKEIFANGTLDKYHPEGLYSEVIFGPKIPWKCACGAVNGSSYDGEKCSNCGVTCSDGSSRTKQFAKIKLPKKVLCPMFKKHLQSLFGIKAIKDIFNPMKYNMNIEDPYFYDITTNSLRKKKQIKNFDEMIFKTMPVYDIASLNVFFDYMKEDKILKNILTYVINPDYLDFVFTDEIVVTPPSSRPIVNSGPKKDIPEISKFYKSFLSLTINNYWENPSRKDEEFNRNIYNFQKIYDEMELFIFDKMFLEKTSVMRDAFSGSTVEFSARAVIIPEPAIPPYGIAVPRDTALKLNMPEFLHFLLKEMEKLRIQLNSEFEDMDVHQMIQMVRAGNTNFPVDEEIFKRFLQSEYSNKKFVIERAPVLWRYNFSGMLVTVVLFENDGYKDFKILMNDENYVGPRLSDTQMYNNRVMMINTTIAQAFNSDYDGDSMSIFALHSNQAKRDWRDAFLGSPSNIEFEHNNSLIPSPEHEAIYAMHALTFKCKDVVFNLEDLDYSKAIELKDFKYTFNKVAYNWSDPVIIKEEDKFYILPYPIAVLNRVIGFNFFTKNPGEMAKKQTKKAIKEILKIVGHENFYKHFHSLNKFLLWCSTAVYYCSPTFSLKDFAVGSKEITNYKNTLINEPYLGFHQNDILFSDYVKPEIATDPDNSLYKVFRSDARIKSVQLLKAASNSGIPTNIHGKAFINNIKEDLLYGHTKEGFFQSGDSARLALAQRQEAIPKGGELQRRFYYILGFLKLSRTEDCNSKKTFSITIENKDHLESLNGRYYINEFGLKKHLLFDKIPEDDYKNYIGKTFNFRYPGGCEHPGYKICNCCFGSKQPQSVNLGAAVGSYISESIIQSVLRTHHFSGAFITNIRKEILDLIKRNRFESPNLIFIDKKNQVEERNDIETLRGFYDEVYPNPDDIELIRRKDLDTINEFGWEIKVNEAPFNDDSVKKLNNIIQVIDRDRKKDDLLSEEEMYKKLLQEIILPNGILSIYVELIMSILFFDENGVMCRYGGEPDHQIALKNIIGTCDPKLTIFYNFNSTAVAKILKDSNKILGAEHMYSNMLKLFDA